MTVFPKARCTQSSKQHSRTLYCGNQVSADTEARDCFALVALHQHKLERTFALGLQSKLAGWLCSDQGNGMHGAHRTTVLSTVELHKSRSNKHVTSVNRKTNL